MNFAREGHPFMISGFIMAFISWNSLFAIHIWTPAIFRNWMILPAVTLTLLTCFIFFFFRDPERQLLAEEGVVLSPGDGKIIDIQEVDESSFLAGRCQRITIFLSIFNVHVQRAPISGKVAHHQYYPGEYMLAWNPKASEENEQSSLGIINQEGSVLVRQIAGFIARRIVTYPKKGTEVKIGDRIGIIKFGSRVDLFIPIEWNLLCSIGDKVLGGITIFAHINKRISNQAESSQA